MDFRQQLREVRQQPGMSFGRPELRYDQLVAFVLGMSIGSNHVMLDGFQEFLILKFGRETSIFWSGLACQLCLPSGKARPVNETEEAIAVSGLFDLLDEFLAEIKHPQDRVRLHHEYLMWRQSFDWYDVDLDRFHSSPAPPMVDLDEAAALLGLTKSGVFDLIATSTLRSSRIGADLFLGRHDVEELTNLAEEPRRNMPDQS